MPNGSPQRLFLNPPPICSEMRLLNQRSGLTWNRVNDFLPFLANTSAKLHKRIDSDELGFFLFQRLRFMPFQLTQAIQANPDLPCRFRGGGGDELSQVKI